MSIDSEISIFKNNRFEDFTSRFNKFVENVKKIVTAITTELNWYKAAFKDFWNKTSKDFRHLADVKSFLITIRSFITGNWIIRFRRRIR